VGYPTVALCIIKEIYFLKKESPQNQDMKIKEILCKSAIGKCGFLDGGWAINPYVGCGHACVYCYARFIKRFTNHSEPWGTFVDVRVNIADVLEKQLKSSKYEVSPIYIGTVTDPYQPLERKYQLMRKILAVLKDHPGPVSILTKSDLILRDLDLLKDLKKVDVSLTVNNLDEKWSRLTEPYSSPPRQRLKAMKKLVEDGLEVSAMMGPFWPFFTKPKELFSKFKQVGVSHVFTESFNSSVASPASRTQPERSEGSATTNKASPSLRAGGGFITSGSNWFGVKKVLEKNYPQLLPKMEEIFFNSEKFNEFYRQAEKEVKALSKKYNLPVSIYFRRGHAGKIRKFS
jgi:DNA repair photolyase